MVGAGSPTSSAARTDPIVGIDLGTTNSLVAIAGWSARAGGGGASADELAPRVLADEAGRALVPSVVRYGAAGTAPTVGGQAREGASEHAGWTVASVKRLMGRGAHDVHDAASLGYEVIAGSGGEGGAARVRLPDGRVLTPEEVSSHILAHLKRQAEARLGTAVSRAVITVPAYFDDAQRQATREAGRLAGLEVVRIVNEPTAAALAYGLGAGGRGGLARERIVAVYDFGGGTFDVSVLRITPGGAGGAEGGERAEADLPETFQVLATAGDTRLGGDDVDAALVALLIGGTEVSTVSHSRPPLNSEESDHSGIISFSGPHKDTGGTPVPPGLSITVNDTDRANLRRAAERAKVELSTRESTRVHVVLTSGRVLDRTVTRAELEALAGPLVERTLDACRRALRDAKRAMGGASIDAVVLVGGSTRMPLVRRRVAEMFGMEPYTALDPDQVVALGAAVQASILAGARRDAVLLDVIPLSLGIGTVGGAVAKVLVRNSPIPARASELFSTSVDRQTGIELSVYQGEREMAADCRLLGHFKLGGLPPMPAGIPKVRVTFDIDASGVLHVSAVEERSGKRASLQVVPAHGLTNAEVQRLEREALVHARDDMTRHRVVDLIANARLDLRWVLPRSESLGERVPAPARERLRDAGARLTALVEAAERDWRNVNPDELHKAKDEFDRASMPVHEASILESLQREAGERRSG